MGGKIAIKISHGILLLDSLRYSNYSIVYDFKHDSYQSPTEVK
ncbi:conserved protein of unknown function [Limnospira indica PCC 8005]|uniref:Uncharacterized protein n=1 Tax=Limnospira indica PCC 8005 TaxID=376219 RepID=A0A9P1KFQ2_9CYAN|nr:conserved protein of unknown function [Limnospira indica PCC 8005]